MAQVITPGQFQSERPVYYVAPPTGPNIAAAFWHGFHQTRSPWASDLFKRRLDAMDPNQRASAMGQALNSMRQVLAEYMDVYTSGLENNLDREKIAANIKIAERKAQATESAAITSAQARIGAANIQLAGQREQSALIPDTVRPEIDRDMATIKQASETGDIGTIKRSVAGMADLILGSGTGTQLAINNQFAEIIRTMRADGAPNAVIADMESFMKTEAKGDPGATGPRGFLDVPVGARGESIVTPGVEQVLEGLPTAVSGRVSATQRRTTPVPVAPPGFPPSPQAAISPAAAPGGAPLPAVAGVPATPVDEAIRSLAQRLAGAFEGPPAIGRIGDPIFTRRTLPERALEITDEAAIERVVDRDLALKRAAKDVARTGRDVERAGREERKRGREAKRGKKVKLAQGRAARGREIPEAEVTREFFSLVEDPRAPTPEEEKRLEELAKAGAFGSGAEAEANKPKPAGEFDSLLDEEEEERRRRARQRSAQ